MQRERVERGAHHAAHFSGPTGDVALHVAEGPERAAGSEDAGRCLDDLASGRQEDQREARDHRAGCREVPCRQQVGDVLDLGLGEVQPREPPTQHGAESRLALDTQVAHAGPVGPKAFVDRLGERAGAGAVLDQHVARAQLEIIEHGAAELARARAQGADLAGVPEEALEEQQALAPRFGSGRRHGGAETRSHRRSDERIESHRAMPLHRILIWACPILHEGAVMCPHSRGASAGGVLIQHMKRTETLRVDLHARSRDRRGGEHDRPTDVRSALRARGMDLVTLLDRDTIDGCLELRDAGHEDVFLSASVTATFAEDGCRIGMGLVHVTELQFAEAMRRRGDLHELIAYLDREIEGAAPDGPHLAYFLCHPFRGVDNRPFGRRGSLRAKHLEQALVLFPAFEVQGGCLGRGEHALLHDILDGLDAERLERLADRHGLTPRGAEPWRKARVGGAGAPGAARAGRAWTEFDRLAGAAPRPDALVAAMRHRATRTGGTHDGVAARSAVWLEEMGRSTKRSFLLRRVTDAAVNPGRCGPARRVGFRAAAMGLRALACLQPAPGLDLRLALAVSEACADRPLAQTRAAIGDPDERTLHLADAVFGRVCARLLREVERAKGGSRAVRAVGQVSGSVLALTGLVAPYVAAARASIGDRQLQHEVRTEFGVRARPSVVLVTDTFFEVNGVAKTVRRMLREAERRDAPFCVVVCVEDEERRIVDGDPELRRFVADGRLHLLDAQVAGGMPEYDGLRVRLPSPLELLHLVESIGATRMQISTPGPVGLLGLVIGRALGLWISSTFHTNFPEYVEDYSGSRMLEGFAWSLTIRFYQAVDEVVVPSRAMEALLEARGLRERRVLMLDRWVDVDRFCPARRSADYYVHRGVARDATVFVYVGRVSVEKNLACLADAFTELCARGRAVHLVVVGDGPFRADMERRTSGLPVTYCGFLGGDELPTAIASAHAKVFPSTTDTWGNAPLEAMASGLPVIVTDQGGPQEFVEHGVQGLHVRGRSVSSLVVAMEQLLDPDLRARMGQAAREHAVARRVDRPYRAIIDPDAYFLEQDSPVQIPRPSERGQTPSGPRLVRRGPFLA